MFATGILMLNDVVKSFGRASGSLPLRHALAVLSRPEGATHELRCSLRNMMAASILMSKDVIRSSGRAQGHLSGLALAVPGAAAWGLSHVFELCPRSTLPVCMIMCNKGIESF